MGAIFETPEHFVKAYMDAYINGETLEDLAKEYGSTWKSIMAKTGKFRSMGIRLPSLKSKRDVDPFYLNKIVSEKMSDARRLGVEETPAQLADTIRVTKTIKSRPVPISELPQCEQCGIERVSSINDFVCSDKCADEYWANIRSKTGMEKVT